MYCYLCATEILGGDSYCRNCGAESGTVPAGVHKNSWLSLLGNFLLGAILFVVVVFLLAALLSNSPQFSILILFVFGTLLGGVCMVLLNKLRAKPVMRRGSMKESKSAQIYERPLLELPQERFIRVPDSVTDSTTSKLKI